MAYVKLITADNKQFYTSNGNLFRVPGIFTYTVTTHFTNVSGTNVPETLVNGQTATFTVSAATNYYLPFSISVTGVSYTYDRNTGTITLGDDAWDDIDITIVATSELLTINLYQSSAEQIRVDKTSFLTSVGTLTGVLRSECSVSTPVIMVEAQALPTFNYAYISLFNRYYYVTEIQSVRNGLWAIYMSCDVLMTYKNGITGLTTTVLRNEVVGSNCKCIRDDRAIFTGTTNILTKASTLTSPFNNQTAATWAGTSGYRYVLITSNGDRRAVSTDTSQGAGKMITTSRNNYKYVLNELGIAGMMKELLGATSASITNFFSNNPMEAFLSLRAYPFDFYNKVSSGLWQPIYFGSWSRDPEITDPTYAYDFNKVADQDNRIEVARFSFTDSSNYNWLDFESTYSLFLPYYGYINIPFEMLYGRTIRVFYTIDFDTGRCLAQIGYSNLDYTSFTELKRAVFNIGIDMPVSASNLQEIMRSILQTGLLLISAATFGLSTPAVGVAVAASAGEAVATSTALTTVSTELATQSTELGAVAISSSLFPKQNSAPNKPQPYGYIGKRSVGSIGARAISDFVTHYERGSNEGVPAFDKWSTQTPYFLIEKPNIIEPTGIGKQRGFIHYALAQLSTLSGYTECIDVKITGADFATALQSEVVEIKHFLETGVILPVTSS